MSETSEMSKNKIDFRICNAEGLNISICNARMNDAAAVLRQPYSLGVVV